MNAPLPLITAPAPRETSVAKAVSISPLLPDIEKIDLLTRRLRNSP